MNQPHDAGPPLAPTHEDTPRRHLKAAAAHEQAADRHEKSAAYWDEKGDVKRAELQRDLAAFGRQGAELERRRAAFLRAEGVADERDRIADNANA